MRFDDETPGRLILRDGDAVLAEYVFEPGDAQLESPRPYALLFTRAGREVTAYRPDDHVWHKGLSLALPHVGPHNFWGGPTYVTGEGYVQQPNNGAQVHRRFEASDTPVADAVAQLARIDEALDWVTQDGGTVLAEHRALTASAVDDDTWALTWSSQLRNVSDEPLAFGSPTSHGRPDAGYAGVFWRGPAAFTGGAIIGPDGEAGDAARGTTGPWLACLAADGEAGVVVLDAGAGESPWFARSSEYAGLCPAPFFFDDTVLEPGAVLHLGAVVLVGGADAASHAPVAGANLVAAVRAEAEARAQAVPAPEASA
jgi:Methane oxygenase PmoA